MESQLEGVSFSVIKAVLMGYLPNVVLAIIVLLVGLFVVKAIVAGVGSVLKARKVDQSLTNFLKTVLRVLLQVLLFISVAGMVGIDTTSFVAALGAAGLAVGFALQGSLANIAGAVLIMVFKPFKVGQYIEANGKEGTVQDIGIFMTKLLTVDNKAVYLPNGVLANSNITNFSEEELRRLDLVFGIAYGDDLKKAKTLLEKLITEDERFLKDPEPVVGVVNLGDSSVDLAFRPWVKSDDYWPARFDTLEKVKLAFDENQITIPFPQSELHVSTNILKGLVN